MTVTTLQVSARIRWWVKPYIYTLAFFCATFGTTPDWEKVGRVLMRGLIIEAKP